MLRERGVLGIGTPRVLMHSAFHCTNGYGVYVLTAKTHRQYHFGIFAKIFYAMNISVITLLSTDSLMDSNR